MTRLGLADANLRAHLLARSARGALLLRRERLRNCALLIALRKISELERVGVVSPGRRWLPWLDHTAVAALTGARPEELRAAQIRKNSHGALEIRIAGAKVSDTKGYSWRIFTFGDDASHEYAHLAATGAGWKVVDLPPGVTDYPDAFSAALHALARKCSGALKGYRAMSIVMLLLAI